jgi:hypothetical protein
MPLISRFFLVNVMTIATAVLSGCGGPTRPVLTPEQHAERSLADQAASLKTFEDALDRIFERINREVERGEPVTLDVLAMSGGGDFGAFGAGVLVGWGKVTDPAFRRPDFDAVTGVSTGALLAPFAFLGTDQASETINELYRNPQKDWTRERGPLFFLPTNPSFMTLPGLERDIRKAVNNDVIAEMAEASKKGKVLIISATDLDLGRQKFWNVGAESEAAVASGNFDRVQKIMLASAAIPAVFPPVEIDGGLYADGGVTANVFVRLDPREPRSLVGRWKALYPDRPFPRARYWVIVNNTLVQEPKTAQPRWPKVIGPSLSTSIRSATIAEVRWLTAQADYVNAAWGTNIEVRMLAIPSDWRAPVPGDFQKESMESLSDLGQKLGADPQSWKILVDPTVPAPNAPGK